MKIPKLLLIIIALAFTAPGWAFPPSPPSSGGSPAGASGSVQCNNAGAFGACSNVTDAAIPTVVNALNSDSTTSALSAAQGKALDTAKQPKATGLTASKPLCTAADGTFAVCAGTEGVWDTPNASTTGSAGSLKSPATTGVLTATGAAAGTTRNMTHPDADFTVNYKSGAYTDGHIIGADGTTGALKDLGAKTTDNSTDDHILAKISGAVENATIVKTIYLPVAYFEDGAAPPAAAAVLASTRKVKTRAFDGASNENLEVSFTVPIDYSSGLKFRFIGYVSSATAPAENEVVAFSFAACSVGNSDLLSCSAGTAQTSSLTAAAGYAQYDRLAGAWSNAITVTDIAAGETVQGILIRLAESTDTYAQDFALAGIEIKYVATFIMGSAY